MPTTGNWESITTDSVEQERQHNRQNQVTDVESNELDFDDNGNTTTDETGRTLTYDAWNRLVSVSGSPGVTHTYDALGRRIRETRGTTVTDLYYSDQWQVLEERTGSSKMHYVWSPVYVDAMVLRDRDANGDGTFEERLYAMQDANFNVTGLASVSGTVVERYTYDPYGVATVYEADWDLLGDPSDSAYAWTYLHQGGRYDAASGLYYFRNRDYSPTLGRWVQVDPIRYAAGDANLYRYVGNRPPAALDPSGLWELRCRELRDAARLTNQRHCWVVCDGKSYSLMNRHGTASKEINAEEDGLTNGSVIASGVGSCECIAKKFAENSQPYPYKSGDCNSNYFANNLLLHCGIWVQRPGRAWGWDDCKRKVGWCNDPDRDARILREDC
jgi:RHS repeat-associated protein